MNNITVIVNLAITYPQLYLDPDKADIEEYKSCILRGHAPAACSLSHFVMDEKDSLDNIDTPAGTARVITLYNRHDFEVFVRCMMAAKDGPKAQVPATMGASTIIAFNWPKINAHKEAFFKKQQASGVLFPDWSAEFKRFTSVRENYQDMLIVLSCGPYSDVSVERVNELMTVAGHETLSEDEWKIASGSIRKYHELTHFVCRKLYPDKIDEIWDELVADAVGLFGAFGEYSKELEELFLGITDRRYTGGRLENYTTDGVDLNKLADAIDIVLNVFETMIASAKSTDFFDIMITLENSYDSYHSYLESDKSGSWNLSP